jgi:hypothetical protein
MYTTGLKLNLPIINKITHHNEHTGLGQELGEPVQVVEYYFQNSRHQDHS